MYFGSSFPSNHSNKSVHGNLKPCQNSSISDFSLTPDNFNASLINPFETPTLKPPVKILITVYL